MLNDERVREWLEAWSRLWDLPALIDRVEVRFNPRLRRSLGRCHAATGRISLHPALASCPVDTLREVLCHEVAHVAVALRVPRRFWSRRRIRPHGPEWARLMELAGYRPRATFVPGELPEPVRSAVRPRRMFRHRCPGCGAERLARRPVRRWRCRRCHEAGRGGGLEISAEPLVS